MKGYLGGAGLVVAAVVAVMSSGGSYRFKTEGDYVRHCKTVLAREGLSNVVTEPGCKCMYRNARAVAERDGVDELTDDQAEAFFDECLGPVLAEMEARAAWQAESDYSSGSYSDDSWSDDGSDWGTN